MSRQRALNIYNGRVAPTAFRWYVLPGRDVEDYISVLRGDPKDLDMKTRRFKPRIEGDLRYGFALLAVRSIREIGIDNDTDFDIKIDVQPFPSKRHPNHAGIVVEIKEERVTALTPISEIVGFRCSKSSC